MQTKKSLILPKSRNRFKPVTVARFDEYQTEVAEAGHQESASDQYNRKCVLLGVKAYS